MRIRKIYILIVAAALLVACSSEDTENEDQASTIVSYLEGTHDPTLISSSDLAAQSEIEENPEFYTRYGNYAYRYIATYYEEGRDTWREITSGSNIEITLSIYQFSTSVSTSDLPIYTNDPAYKDAYESVGLNTQYWSFTPLSITVGSSEIFPALQDAFIGCREGDVVEIYTTYLMGYENVVVGLIDKESAMTMFLYIESVN
ncbi:MAG: hypothetical protein SNG35_02875 [Rikenellaceae bacterium]